MTLSLDERFKDVLKPLGDEAAAFFLAVSLYHAGLSFDTFGEKLEKHFGISFILADEVVR